MTDLAIKAAIDAHPISAAVRALQAFDLTGSGDPTGKVQAPIGARYARIDGTAGSALYAKTGLADTAWTVIA